jgi:enoyl-CoA hydratase/carnithine racemase
VARVTLDRPPLNLLSPSLLAALGDTFRDLAGDPTLRVVVLAGAGRAFSAGVDVRAMRGLDPPGARAFIEGLQRTIEALEAVPVPTVARLHGHVLGGALELVLAADVRLAADGCHLGMPEVAVGIPSVIHAALLPGLVGPGRAAELLLTGEPIAAPEAERWGLVHRAVDSAALDAEVERWVARFLGLPPGALRLQKALLGHWRRTGLDQAIADSVDAFARAFATAEPGEAMGAFLDRRRGRGPGPPDAGPAGA